MTEHEHEVGDLTAVVYITPFEFNTGKHFYDRQWHLFIKDDPDPWPVCSGYRLGETGAELQALKAVRWYQKDPSRLTGRQIPPGCLLPPSMPGKRRGPRVPRTR